MSAVTKPLLVPTPQPPVTQPRVTPHHPEPRKRWPWLLLIAIIIGVGGWVWYQKASQSQKQADAAAANVIKTAKVTMGTFERTRRVAGQTTARNFSNITVPVLRGPEGGRELVLLKVAKSGSFVKKGELVAQIDAQSFQDHVDDLGDTIEGAEADVRKRSAEQMIELEQLAQTLRVARSDFEKAKLDFSTAEVKTDIERQLLKLAYDEAEAKYNQQLSDVKSKELGNKAELRILELTRDRHVRHRDRHKLDLTKFTMHAGMNGLVVMSTMFRGGEMAQVQEGDRVFPGQGFMKIVDTSNMQVEANINQAESGDFRIGQQANIKLDAFPGLELKGKVHSIGAIAVGGWRQNSYVRNIPVKLLIQGSDPRLIPDLSASADVLLDRDENQKLLPLSALREENGKTFAYVKTGDQFERREVQTGKRNSAYATVTSGLQAGEEVRITW